MRRGPGFMVALFLGACSGTSTPISSGSSANSNRVSSNVLGEDYVGSRACEPCHTELYQRWQTSPMHRMTRDAHTAGIQAPFSGDTFDFKGERVTFEEHGGQRYMRLAGKESKNQLYRITRVIGGRYREDFAGALVRDPTPNSPALGLERILPVSYLLFEKHWRYKGYSVMSRERPSLKTGPVWQRTCIFCHNTVPYLLTVLDELYGPGAPVYQGSVSTELPKERAFQFEITDLDALEDELAKERKRLGVPGDQRSSEPKAELTSSIEAIRHSFGAEHLAEIGVGCEACHGGSRGHVENPKRRPSFAEQTALFRVRFAAGKQATPALDINRSCAKCHTVLFSRYPFTWEGGARHDNPGGSHINSGEARDFLLGGCSARMACTACHDPHGEDSRARLAELEGARGNALCVSCHQQFGAPGPLRAHTHHLPGSTGSACLSCHMPKKNMGLAYELTRYHRIGSPTDRERVEGDRPLECALCHADKSVEQMTRTMERLWGKRYERSALRSLYKNLDQNVVLATLRHGKPHEQAVASAIAGEARMQQALPLVVEQLGNEYPLVRFFAKKALEELTREKLELDMNAPGPELLAEAKQKLDLP